MKSMQLVLIAALVALSSGAQAEWLEIHQFEDGMRVYVDKSTASKEGDIAEILHLVRWGEPQIVDDKHAYQSTVVKAAYDCVGKHERYLSSKSYAEPMGNGAKVREDEDSSEVWYTISESSMEHKLWSIACAVDEQPL